MSHLLPRPVLGTIIQMLVVAASARATTWPEPIRPLTTAESIEMAVSNSDAVVVGSVGGLRDSIDEAGAYSAWVTVAPRRVLEGTVPDGAFRVYFPTISMFSYDQVNGWLTASRPTPITAILFLRCRKDGVWVIAEHPEHYGQGVVRVADGGPGMEETSVLAAIARMTPEGLAQRSTAVVVGRTRALKKGCRYHGRPITCTKVCDH